MPKKLTTKEFIKKAKLKHDGFYDYGSSIYNGSHNKISIICPIHGEFLQKASSHLSGHGCDKCGEERHKQKMTKNTNDFITKAQEKHNFKYTYNNAVYTGRRNCYITITCPKHGDFNQLVCGHLSGKGCKQCAIEQQKPSVGFTKKAWASHCNSKNVTTAYCYILRLYDDEESFIKIGITHDLKLRMYHFPYNVETIYIIKDTPDVVYNKEQSLHKKYKKYKYNPKISFAGKRECFTLNIFK